MHKTVSENNRSGAVSQVIDGSVCTFQGNCAGLRYKSVYVSSQLPAPVPQHGGQGEQLQPPAAHDQMQASNTDLQTVMQERGLTLLGEPCEKCGCPIARDLFGKAVCYRCYPTRGYHEYADLVGQMYPRKQRPLF